MSQRLWLLVEWMDVKEFFPSYGVVHVGSLIGSETQLHVGKTIYVRDKIGNSPRRAQVLRISDDKRYIKEQKKLIKREDCRVKNVLSLYMRKIREMKSDPMYTGLMNDQQMSSASNGNSLPQVVADTDTSSDSDSEAHSSARRHRNINAAPHFNNRDAPSSSRRPSSRHQSPHQRSRSMICSTPVSAINGNKNLPLTFDQGTQTNQREFYKQKVEEMEALIKMLYSRFLNVVALDIQSENASLLSLSGTDTEDSSESESSVMRSSPEQNGHHADSNSNGQPSGELASTSNAKTLQVRRVSAHTTNTVEHSFGNEDDMVPIGAGNAVVPRRLLNDIDWTSYSTSTRQLLQAVFPRKVLATHSLTGKQSPAFTNKPPKKRLDPSIVNDIVDTVSERCGVSKRLVRSSITVKCTDESKLYRNRQQHKHARLENHNQENVPPTASSDDSSTVTE